MSSEKKDSVEPRKKFNWDFFDGIYCVNLYSRDDRYEYSKKLFDDLGINVKFHRVHKNKDPVRGCFESHIDIISESYDKGYENVLIFEDDCVPNMSALTPESLNNVIKFAKKNTEWDLIYLGCCPNINRGRIIYLDNGMVRLHANCTHSYIVNRRMMEKMYKMKYAGCEIDSLYTRNPNTFGILPTFFQQKGDESDLGGISMKGKNYAMRCIEYYAYYVNVPLVLFIPMLLILLILLLMLKLDPVVIFFIFFAFILLVLIYASTFRQVEKCGY